LPASSGVPPEEGRKPFCGTGTCHGNRLYFFNLSGIHPGLVPHAFKGLFRMRKSPLSGDRPVRRLSPGAARDRRRYRQGRPLSLSCVVEKIKIAPAEQKVQAKIKRLISCMLRIYQAPADWPQDAPEAGCKAPRSLLLMPAAAGPRDGHGQEGTSSIFPTPWNRNDDIAEIGSGHYPGRQEKIRHKINRPPFRSCSLHDRRIYCCHVSGAAS